MSVCVLLHLLISPALRAVVEALYKINYYYYCYLLLVERGCVLVQCTEG